MNTFERFDTDRQLFVYRVTDIDGKEFGYSCIGLEYARQRAIGILRWLEMPGLPPTDNATAGEVLITPDEDGYRMYEAILHMGAGHADATGERCPIELTPQLIGLEGKRVRVKDSYGDDRRFKVGKSGGWMPCHIELKRSNSNSGPAVSGAPFQSIEVL